MAMKVFVACVTLALFGQASCFGNNFAALAALGGEGGLGALAALGGGAGGFGATSGFGGTTGGFGGTTGGFGASSGFGGSTGLGSLGSIAAFGGEGAGGLLRLQLLSQPGFTQQLSQCRLISTIFEA